MRGLVPYVHFDGTARDALTFYREIFGGELTLHSFAEFGRSNGPQESVAHGILRGPVDLYGADADNNSGPLAREGIMLSLLGSAEPAILESWFTALATGGEVIEPLKRRPWGAHDGQVKDRFGLTWLIGYQG